MESLIYTIKLNTTKQVKILILERYTVDPRLRRPLVKFFPGYNVEHRVNMTSGYKIFPVLKHKLARESLASAGTESGLL